MSLEELSRVEPLSPDLSPYLENNTKLGWHILRHPLVFSIPYFEQLNAILNKQLLAKQAAVTKALAKGDWSYYIALHERPYRLQALLRVPLTLPGYGEILISVYSDSENLHQNLKTWRSLFKITPQSERAHFMTEDEHNILESLPNNISIYRGSQKHKGLSWTLTEELAKWFALRFQPQGVLLKGVVLKKHIYAYLDGRGEQEIVADPAHIRIIALEHLSQVDTRGV